MLQREEVQLLKGRIHFLCYAIVTALLILGFGYWSHQMVYSRYYGDKAEQNSIKEIPLIAQRGRIYDRYNRLLADSRPSYNIVFIRENSPHNIQQTVGMLAPGIDMSVEDLKERVDRRKREPKFRPITLKEDISAADMAFVKAHRYELPEISVEEQPRRRYLSGELAAHALGYVGEVNEDELMKPEYADFKSGDLVGKSGLEKEYNAVLRGKDGFKRVIVNSFGREMGRLDEEAPVPGNDLHTTIDLDLQKAVEEAMADQTGSAIAIDPHTGEILAIVSKPSFDPNLFATRISNADWSSLINDPRKPLQNRVIQSHYAPGSVFKVFMAAAGLEAHTLNPLHNAFCPGYAVFYGRSFACDKHDGHGTIGLHDAIMLSCNVFFYNVGKDLGIDRISKYATMMGLGHKTGIDLPNEDAGLIPSQEWKQRVYKTKWYEGETISVAIGQGQVSFTPIQAAYAMGGLTSGGRLKQPHLVTPESLRKAGFKANDIYVEEYPIQEETVDIVTSAMWGVVNVTGGTGSKARVVGFDVAGKTGTAQVVGRESNLSRDFKDNAWFVGFAPYRNPEIVVAAMVENVGHGGTYAAPIAHAVLETYYQKKTGTFEQNGMQKVAQGNHVGPGPGGR
jgi:penicillin-binding protein 2